MPAKMSTGMAAKMTRLPVPVLLRWPSWMRSEPRSGFAETCELAIGPPAPCIDAKTQLRLRAAQPENYTNGSARDRGSHIVTQQSAIRAEIPLMLGGRPGRKGHWSKALVTWQEPKIAMKAWICVIRLEESRAVFPAEAARLVFETLGR